MADKHWLNEDGLLFFGSQFLNGIKALIPSKTSDLTNDSNFAVDSSYVHTDNNYTTTEKTKLSGISSGAQVNVIETVKVNNTALTPSSKAVNISVPTKTSDITNDSGFITSADVPSYPSMATNTNTSDWTTGKVVDAAVLKTVVYDAVSQIGGKADASTTYTKTQVDSAISSAVTNMYKYKGSVATVSALPSSDNTTGDVYNVEATGMNYAWNGTAWDALGEIFTITALTNAEITAIVNQVFA